MSTTYGRDEEGNITIEFDSRWRHPHLLGIYYDEPLYAELQQMWEQATGETIPNNHKPGNPHFQLPPWPYDRKSTDPKPERHSGRPWGW